MFEVAANILGLIFVYLKAQLRMCLYDTEIRVDAGQPSKIFLQQLPAPAPARELHHLTRNSSRAYGGAFRAARGDAVA